MTTRCDLTDLLPADCSHCRGLDDLGRDIARGELGPVFTARYPGVCADCGDRFKDGDQVRSDTTGGYLGPCCLKEDGDV